MSWSWDVVKDGLGLLSALMMAFPWFRDFVIRRRAGWVRTLPLRGKMAELGDRVADRLERWTAAPKPMDFLYMLLGLQMLALSFAIGVWRSLFVAS